MGVRDPFDLYRTNCSPLVDAVLGKAYLTVKLVADNLVMLQVIYNNLTALLTLSTSTSPTTLVAAIGALPSTTRNTLIQALFSSLIDVRNGDTEPTTPGIYYINSSGYVVMS